ncbi:MAG: pentapeptide repeat-containing protein [Planctomycetota bacterium]
MIDLKKVFRKHSLFVESQGRQGKRADLTGANLSGAHLGEANLSGANLGEANLSGANLTRADLSWARLYRANLSGAHLGEADLSWANLNRANLTRANLSGAYLIWAYLTRTNLTGADLSGADLTGTLLDFSNLKGVIGIELLFQDPRYDGGGYQLVRWSMNGKPWYNSGCRSLSESDALIDAPWYLLFFLLFEDCGMVFSASRSAISALSRSFSARRTASLTFISSMRRC